MEAVLVTSLIALSALLLSTSMRAVALATVAIAAVLVGAAAGFEYEYATLNGKVSELNQTVSDLNQTISSQEQQISSLSSMVPDSEIFGVSYAMTLYSHVNGSLNASGYYAIWDYGLPYRSGQQVTLYLDASQLFSVTGLMNITYLGSRTQGFSVSSVDPSLPQVVQSGPGGNRSVLAAALNTPSQPYRGFLQVYIQAYVISAHGLPVPPNP